MRGRRFARRTLRATLPAPPPAFEAFVQEERDMSEPRKHKFETLSVHAGYKPDPVTKSDRKSVV